MMFKKKSESTDILDAEKAYNEAILQLIAARTRVAELELIWANGEENPNFFSLFGKFAELHWMYNDAANSMAKKQSGVRKAFKNIFQEEKIFEESKKELQNCGSKLTKLQKQLESARKKNDVNKVQVLETELETQTAQVDDLTSSVESQSKKLELYKIKELKRTLRDQAEGVLTLAGHCQQLYAAHMQLIDLMPDSPPTPANNFEESTTDTTGCLEQSMCEVVSRVSDILSVHPPANGGIDPKKLASSGSTPATPFSPLPSQCCRRSFVGLDLLRAKSKDDLCPSKPPPPAIKPRKLPQKPPKHSIYKVDTGAADEVEPAVHGRSSPTPLQSPISLSQVVLDDSPSRRPQVDYTKGMYCEIVIPYEGSSQPSLFHGGMPTVPIRRTSSDTPPNELKHSRNLSLDQKLDKQMFENTLKHSKPLESTTDSETTSAQYSSSEDLEVVVGEIDPGYARVNIRPLGGPSPVRTGSQDSEESGGYANPVDALNLPSDVVQKRISMGPATVPENKVCDFSEEPPNSPYQSVEDVRKMRELQNHQRQQMRQSGSKNRSHSVSPNTSHTNLQQYEDESSSQVNYCDDNPGYSRPFDALSSMSRVRVSLENLSRKPPFTPAPPVMRRTTSGDRPGKERSARSIHKTNMVGTESEKVSSEDNRNPVLRGGSCKKSWKVGEYNTQTNSTVTPPTPPPPLPLSERPKVKEQWQLPWQKQQQERMSKLHLRSRSDHTFQSELSAPSKGSGVENLSIENDTYPLRVETGRTSSDGSMFKMKTKPPLMNIHQLKAKKPSPTRAN